MGHDIRYLASNSKQERIGPRAKLLRSRVVMSKEVVFREFHVQDLRSMCPLVGVESVTRQNCWGNTDITDEMIGLQDPFTFLSVIITSISRFSRVRVLKVCDWKSTTLHVEKANLAN